MSTRETVQRAISRYAIVDERRCAPARARGGGVCRASSFSLDTARGVPHTPTRASGRNSRARAVKRATHDAGRQIDRRGRRDARVDARETSREMSAHKLSEEALRRHAAHMRNERERAVRTKNALKKELDDFVRSGPKVRSTTRAREGWGRGSGRGGDKMGRGRDSRSRLEVANARDASRRDD
jgi:hypothetical protein